MVIRAGDQDLVTCANKFQLLYRNLYFNGIKSEEKYQKSELKVLYYTSVVFSVMNTERFWFKTPGIIVTKINPHLEYVAVRCVIYECSSGNLYALSVAYNQKKQIAGALR